MEKTTQDRVLSSDRSLPEYKISNKYSGLNVLGLVADVSACGYYRVVNPLHYLKMQGANVHYGSHHSMDDFLAYDYIIAPRQHSEDVYEILRFVLWEGKGGTYNTKILTPTGWTTFKNIKIGDKVIGSNGKACNVTGRYERGILPTYRVTFNDNTSVLCDGNHLWQVSRKSQLYTNQKIEVLSTLELLKENLRIKAGYNFRVPLVKPVQYEEQKDLPIDPYILGVILGDGCISSRNFYISSDNLEIAKEIEKVLPDGMYLDVHSDKQYYRYSIKASEKAGKPYDKNIKNKYRDALVSLGLLGTNSTSKFIPQCYQLASPKDRLSLIQGLMDTDGSIDKKTGKNNFTTVSKDLAEGLVALAQSLGGTARIHTTKLRTYLYKGNNVPCKQSYIVSLFLPSNLNIFRYKQSRDIFAHREPIKAIKSIELEGKEPIVCIAVDSPDNLYVTDSFIVTHNCVIFEIDDDLDAVLPSSPAYYAYHPGSTELNMIHKVMSWCDGVTTTTPDMARWCYQNNRNVAVLDNYIDFTFRDWSCNVQHENGEAIFTPTEVPRLPEWKDKIVMLWAGGTTHQEDLKLLGPQIKALLMKYPQLHYAMYAAPQQAKEFMEVNQIPEDRYSLIDARHFLDYPSGLMGDIGLCPLVCNQFNLAKSYLKPVEYLAKGIVPVASNVGPYARFNQKHPGAILLAGSSPNCHARNLIDGVEKLLLDPELLAKMKVQGRQLIYDHYSLEKNIHKWPEAWSEIKNRKLKGELGPPDNKKSKTFYRTYKNSERNDKCPCGSGKAYKKCCTSEAFG